MSQSEQDRILGHAPNRHGRILAGPGTGKSTTVLQLAQQLSERDPQVAVRVVTFTRAATAELADKIRAEGHHLVEPSTLHSFALSLLMSNLGLISLPTPLRLPDDWETKRLLQPDIAERLRAAGHDVDVRIVRKLEKEMAAGWESLDPSVVLLADLNPELRNAYIATWRAHRAVFAYSMFAEIPYSAAYLLQDHRDARRPQVDLLVVDEFQDLNRAEIALVETLASLGVSILAVGDDEQSIYSFRMADPTGILELERFIPHVLDYTLSVSYRCGTTILRAARAVIESGPRLRQSALDAAPGNPDGVFAYLRFPSAAAEQAGVAQLVQYLIDHEAVAPKEIVILVRGDSNDVWSDPLRQHLARRNIPATNIEEALSPLADDRVRRLLAVAHIVANRSDSLAWWAYLKLTNGISDAYIRAVADEALAAGEVFSQRLMRCLDQAPAGAAAATHRRALEAIAGVQTLLGEVDVEHVAPAEDGWATWLMDLPAQFTLDLPTDFEDLARSVGRVVPQSEGLGYYLSQLEPVSKDNALRTDGVAIMTMTRSKGLTFRAAIIMGVEEGVIPSPRANRTEEERRLLYVGMTRAREWLFLTMAAARHGPTGYSGRPNPGASRGRCPFLEPLGSAFQPVSGPAYLKRLSG